MKDCVTTATRWQKGSDPEGWGWGVESRGGREGETEPVLVSLWMFPCTSDDTSTCITSGNLHAQICVCVHL